MSGLVAVVKYIIGLGANVFLPVIMFFIGLIFGLKPRKALRAGLTLGIAFTAMSLFISQLLVGQIAPAAQAMIKNTGMKLTALDVGWTAASTISWGWPYAATMFPIQIGLNLLLIWIGFTKTLNVDLWNIWQKVFAGAIMFGITGNLGMSYLVAILMIVAELKLGDILGKKVQEVSGIPGVTIPHACSTWLLAVTPVLWVVDRIPGLKNIRVDSEVIQKKLGFLGENLVIGLLMGLLIGVLARFSFSKTLLLGINTATVMFILPKIASLFMEALVPISDAASEFMKSRFPGKEIYIGLDWPILAGHTTTITSAILLMPVLILLAIIIPGNKTLPFGDVANFGCLMAPLVALTGGDLIRTMIVGVFVLAISLVGASAVATSFTALAKSVGVAMPKGAVEITWLKTSPIIWGVVELAKKNIPVVILLLAVAALSFFILFKCYGDKTKTVGNTIAK